MKPTNTDPARMANHITGMFIAYTFILVLLGVEVYQTQAIVKLSRALDANTNQNIQLIEQGKEIFEQGHLRDLEIAKLKELIEKSHHVPMEAK